jgi:hypothetical protein
MATVPGASAGSAAHAYPGFGFVSSPQAALPLGPPSQPTLASFAAAPPVTPTTQQPPARTAPPTAAAALLAAPTQPPM